MPDILTSKHWFRYVTSSVEDVTQQLVDRAERRVIDRYREARDRNTRVVPDIGALDQHGVVQLDGWAETDDGTPDPSNMDDVLLDALRETIARIVEHWIESPEGHIDSKSQGARSVSYRKGAQHLPHRVWAPLRPYDDRTPLGGALM